MKLTSCHVTLPNAIKMESNSELGKLKSRRYREKLQDDPIKLELYRAKAKMRAQKYRKKQLESPQKIKETREKNRIRQKKYREEKKNDFIVENTFDPYFCEQESEEDLRNVEKSLAMDLRQMQQKLRARRYREKLQADPIKLELYRAKAKERVRNYRKKQLESPQKIQELREKDRIRQKTYRDKKKNQFKIEETFEPYLCQHTSEEALKKVEKALPKSLRKKQQIINILHNKYLQSANTVTDPFAF